MWFSLVSAFVFAGLSLAFLSIFQKKKKLPPGPIRWPIIGNIPELAIADSKYAHRAMETLALKYGDIMRLGFGVHEACILSSYEAIKEIFALNDATDRYIFEYVKERSFHKVLGIVWSQGAMWTKIRKFTAKGLRDFGFGKYNSMNSILEEDIRDLVALFKELAAKNNGEMEVDSHHFSRSVVNVIWSYVAGYRFSIGDPTINTLIHHGNALTKIIGADNLYNALPFLKDLFPKWTSYDQHIVWHKEYQDFILEMIERSRTMRAERQNTEPENFIELFLDEIDNNKADPETVFTEEQLAVVLSDLFLASSETTGTGMTWAFGFLALHPRVQLKVRDEILKVIGYGPITIEETLRLPYLKATIYEVFRMGNTVPTSAPRTATNDIPIRDFIIPKGCIVMMNLGLVLNDKSYWGDPEVFRPERFLDETGTKVINTERISLVFGSGKRMCMGEGFFWNAVPMYLATLIRTFTIEAIPGSEPDLKNPVNSAVLRPYPFSVKLTWD